MDGGGRIVPGATIESNAGAITEQLPRDLAFPSHFTLNLSLPSSRGRFEPVSQFMLRNTSSCQTFKKQNDFWFRGIK